MTWLCEFFGTLRAPPFWARLAADMTSAFALLVPFGTVRPLVELVGPGVPAAGVPEAAPVPVAGLLEAAWLVPPRL